MDFADIGGVTLHHEHRPNDTGRSTLVFINSLGTDFRIWDEVIARLGNSWPTLRYDKRGHGLSGLGSQPNSIADHARDLAGLLDHLGIGDIVICGLSVGGLIAQGLYEASPSRIRALILCDTGHKIGTAEMWAARIAAVEELGLDAMADGVMERWFTPDFRASQPAKLAGYRAMLARQPAAGYAGTCAAIRDADFTALCATIAVPTLCVVGDQDGATPPDLVRSTAALIPGAHFEIIAGAGHIPCVEQPDALVALISGFLSRIEDRP